MTQRQFNAGHNSFEVNSSLSSGNIFQINLIIGGEKLIRRPGCLSEELPEAVRSSGVADVVEIPILRGAMLHLIAGSEKA